MIESTTVVYKCDQCGTRVTAEGDTYGHDRQPAYWFDVYLRAEQAPADVDGRDWFPRPMIGASLCSEACVLAWVPDARARLRAEYDKQVERLRDRQHAAGGGT